VIAQPVANRDGVGAALPPCGECGAPTVDGRGNRRYCPVGHVTYIAPMAVPPPSPKAGVSSVSSVSSQPYSLSVFPLDVLPAAARALVAEGAASLECPDDLVGVPFLAIAAGVIGNRYAVELKPGYVQRAILWIAVIGDPGTAKSPAQAITQACIDVLQREAHERRARELEVYQRELATWTTGEKVGRGERPTAPADEEHFFTTDSTLEGLARMLGASESITPGFVLIRDELAGWVLSFDAYRSARGGDRQTWLSMWAGMPFKSDRAGRDSIYVPEPAVSVCGGIQPDVLPSLGAESGGRDGFNERFLFSYPDAAPMRWTDSFVSQQARDNVTATFRKLRGREGGIVRLAPAARQVYAQWVNDNADLQESVTGLLRGFYAKLPAQAARVALVLHCVANADDPVGRCLSPQTMAGAIRLIEYFREHGHRAFAAFGALGLVTHPLSARLLRVLNGSPGTWLTTTVIHERLGGHVKSADLQMALDDLEGAGLAKQQPGVTGPKGGRPPISWRCIPREETEETEETSDVQQPNCCLMCGRATHGEPFCAACDRSEAATDDS
jgi:hypothetical protein